MARQVDHQEWGVIIRSRIPDDGHLYFCSYDYRVADQREEIFMELWKQLGEFDIIRERGSIPTKIACSGKPAIAAYLFSIQLVSPSEISEHLNVAESTVKQYISDIRRGERLG